jgi:hypothetical protein
MERSAMSQLSFWLLWWGALQIPLGVVVGHWLRGR